MVELASASEERRLLRIALVNDDMPFLVDSVSMALADAGIGVHVLGHPLLRVARDKAGSKVTYRLAVDLNIPMLGMLKRKAEQQIVDAALKELKKRVEG